MLQSQKRFWKINRGFNSTENLGFDDIKLYTLRGFAFNQINKNDLALKDLDKAIQLNPDFYPKNFFNRAMLKIILNKNDQALSDLDEYLKKEGKENIRLALKSELQLILEQRKTLKSIPKIFQLNMFGAC